MARPSKTQQFTIYQDTGIPSPDPSHDPSPEHDNAFHNGIEDDFDENPGGASILEGIDEDLEPSNIDPTDTEREDGRRESAITSTSISSLPESSSETDQEHATPIHAAYSPQMIRPSFRRPESVRRLQMSSPTPSFERSPRRSALHSRSRVGTPRSNKGSPATRKRHEELGTEGEKKEYPLVLLHVTLLPVQLRWSTRSLQELVPGNLLEDYRLLRSKVSETVAQRGILILHPKDDYELLEERLLEALELKEERITKCGHFRAQGSISSISSSEDSTDSAIGSSIASSNSGHCSTCHHQVKGVEAGDKQKWSIKVYAANGLMRASAWSAAWSEMERVDVEILPWIGDELRRSLDARLQDEELETRQRNDDEEARIREVVEQQLRIEHESRKLAEQKAESYEMEHTEETIFEPESQPLDDFPPIYARQDIPLSVLLKNYLYLLAQDKRNIAICGLAVLALWMSLRTALVSTLAEGPMLPAVYEHDPQRTLTSDVPNLEISNSDPFVAQPISISPTFESAELVTTALSKDPAPTMAPELAENEDTSDEVQATKEPAVLPASSPLLSQQIYEGGDNETCKNIASTRLLFGYM